MVTTVEMGKGEWLSSNDVLPSTISSKAGNRIPQYAYHRLAQSDHIPHRVRKSDVRNGSDSCSWTKWHNHCLLKTQTYVQTPPPQCGDASALLSPRNWTASASAIQTVVLPFARADRCCQRHSLSPTVSQKQQAVNLTKNKERQCADCWEPGASIVRKVRTDLSKKARNYPLLNQTCTMWFSHVMEICNMVTAALGWAQIQHCPVTPLGRRHSWKESQRVWQELGADVDDVI